MKRLLRKWLGAGLAVSLCLTFNVFADEQVSPEQKAKEMYDNFKNFGGTQETLQRNLIGPLLGGGDMTTIDRQTTFNPQVACPSSKEYLTVNIQPKSTGDIKVFVYWDSDMNGQIDRQLTIDNVSGICTNGFITCTPGTWDNCLPKKFAYRDGNLYIAEAELSDLSGCYCINKSCGNNIVMSNLPVVVKTIGGAVASAFRGDSRVAISNSRIVDTSIYFYGQDYSNCNLPAISGGENFPERYFSKTSDAIFKMQVESEVFNQSRDPESKYNLILSGASQSDFVTCQITKTSYEGQIIRPEDIIESVEGNGGSYRNCLNGEPGCIQVILGWEGDNYWCGDCEIHELSHTFRLKRPDLIESAVLEYVAWDDWIQVWLNERLIYSGPYPWTDRGSTSPPGDCELRTSWKRYPNLDLTNLFRSYPPNTLLQSFVKVAVAGCGEGYAIITIRVKDACEVIFSDNNTCQQVENRSDCKLWNEKVNGTYTVRSGVKTGLQPLKSCQLICNQYVCPEYWSIERTYKCDSQGSFDLSDAGHKVSTVVPSVNFDKQKGELIYTDTLKQQGSWQEYPDRKIKLTPMPEGSDCEYTCKVRVNRENTQVSFSGVISSMHTNIQGDYVYLNRKCERNDSGTFICPTLQGEEIVADCRCQDDFPAASTIMQTIRLAGQDLICSTGQKKKMDETGKAVFLPPPSLP